MKALYLCKVSPASVWVDGRRVVCEEGVTVRGLLVKLKPGISNVRAKVIAVALRIEKCTGIQETFRYYPASLSSLTSV